MTHITSNPSTILYLLVCAAPPAQDTLHVVQALQKAQWNTCVITTPQARRWMDIPAIEAITGHLVRTEYKLPGEADPLPKADTMLVMPATFNTINKWAQGIGDTLVASLLCEALGRGTPPIVAVPCLKMDLCVIQLFKKALHFYVTFMWQCCMNQSVIHLHKWFRYRMYSLLSKASSILDTRWECSRPVLSGFIAEW